MDTEVLGKSELIEIPYDIYYQMVTDTLTYKKRQKIIEDYGSVEEWTDTNDCYKYSFLVDNRIGIRYSEKLAESQILEANIESYKILFKIKDKRKLIKYKLIYGF